MVKDDRAERAETRDQTEVRQNEKYHYFIGYYSLGLWFFNGEGQYN